MNDYTKDEIIFITDSTMCSNLNPIVPCPIKDNEGNADYNYFIDEGVKNVDWKVPVGDNDDECERNWAYFGSDGTIKSTNVPYSMRYSVFGGSTVKICKKKIKYSKNQLMKTWNAAECISDFPITANTSGWQMLPSLGDIKNDMINNYKNSDNLQQLKYCYGFDVIKAGNILASNSKIMSQNGKYSLEMQTDGNLVTYGPNRSVPWAANPNPSKQNGSLSVQTDGNLVLYGPNNSGYYWNSGTSFGTDSGKNNILMLQDDGNLCLYDVSTTPFTLRWNSLNTNPEFPISSGQKYNIIKNKAIKYLKDNSYPKMSNDTFDPKNTLNSEDDLFFSLIHKNIYYCNNSESGVNDSHCKTYFDDANKKINTQISKSYSNK
jgi:hypothetical protein